VSEEPEGPKLADSETAKFERYIEAYIKLRDRLADATKAFEETQKPDKELMNMLTSWLTNRLETVGADSVKTKAGTAYTTTRYTASLADPKAFMDFVISNNKLDLLDRKANSAAVRDFVEETGSLPPGANLSAIRTVGVRRAPGT
jgi:hypothetical protein